MNTFMGTDVNIRYAEQVVTPEVNNVVEASVSSRSSRTASTSDPIKAKMRRRLVLGLREVHKSVTLQRAKAVVVAPNIEETEQEGGLDDVVGQIIEQGERHSALLRSPESARTWCLQAHRISALAVLIRRSRRAIQKDARRC